MTLLALPYSSRPASRALLSFTDPVDHADFHGYDLEEQENVKDLHDAMMRIAAAPNVNQGCKAVAAQAAGRRGWSRQYLNKLFVEWEEVGRDWRYLVDGARFPEARRCLLAPETQEWVRAKLLANKRKFAPAIQQIHTQWRSWWRTGEVKFAIPGFVDAHGEPQCPPPCAGYLPRALQEHHLRRVKIEPAVIEMVRYGTHAARALLPHIPGTRDGVRWLEYVSFDDMWLDVMAYVPGSGACRVLQFGAWDMSCSYYLEKCLLQKARTLKNNGSFEQLKQREFLYTVSLFIESYGWPLDYQMHILCERGTAFYNKAKAQWLYEMSGGQIVTGYSGMEGEFIEAWREGKCGNSRAKAGHEGFHGILKNQMGHLKGHMGKDADHTPALDYGREKNARVLDALVVQLPPEERGRIVTGYLTMPEVWRETFDAIQRIHRNPDNECEGFESVIEWRPRGLRVEPLPLAELALWQSHNPRVTGENINEYVDWFDRPETRHERMLRLSAQGRFMAPPPAVMVPFYEDRFALKPIAADGSFSFEQEGRKYRFVPPCPADRLPSGEKVCGFFRPDDEMIHLFSGPDGKNRRYLLTYLSEKKLRRDADAETRGQFFRRKEQAFEITYAAATKATEEQFDQVRAEQENNALVIAENGLLPDNVQRGCTPAAAAVLEITAQRAATARQARDTATREQAATVKRRRRTSQAEAEAARELLAGA